MHRPAGGLLAIGRLALGRGFLLALEGARIYDLDQTPAQLRRWTQLDNVRTYHDFFRAHEQEFKA